MRSAAFAILLLTATAVVAGTLENCELQAKDRNALQACVEAERIKSSNQLRKTSLSTQAAMQQKMADTTRNQQLRSYRAMQARHVRERNAVCRKQAGDLERKACEADMNYAHIEQLAKFAD